jgi:hypothetical protein
MNFTPRVFPSFKAALAVAFEEEASGQAYFAALATHRSGREREALELFVRLEELATRALQPMVTAHECAVFTPHGMHRQGEREAASLASFTWPQLLERMVREYPAYVAEFEELVGMAPDADRSTLQLLVDHQMAMIEFARRELAGEPDATAPLISMIERLEQP